MKIVKITEKGIEFNNGNKLSHYHEQDCCESVYAEWLVLKDYNTLGENGDATALDVEFDNDIYKDIELVKDEGFKLSYNGGGSVFIPCHNSQNGYYSSDLALHYTRKRVAGETTESLNITDCTKDDFDY